MSHKVGKIRNLRVIKALRGESLSIDLGRSWNGVVTAWMKKNSNSETYRSFEVLDNRYLILSKEKTSDYYNGENLIESIEGKWYFDVELIEDGSTIEQSQTIYTGTIYFENDITGSNGVEILDYDNGLSLKTVENTNSINLTKEESNLKADLNISDNQGEGVTVTIEEDGLKVNINYPDSDSTFDSELPVNLAMQSSIGGIPAGTTIGDLNGLTFTQYVELKDFPTILANISDFPNFIQSGFNTSSVEVGASYAPNVTITFDLGTILNGDGSVAGDLVGDLQTLNISSPSNSNAYVDNIISNNSSSGTLANHIMTLGTNSFVISGTNSIGTTTYIDNKGGTGIITSIENAKSDTIPNNLTVNKSAFYYRYNYLGARGTSPTESTAIRALSKSFLNSSNNGSFSINIPGNTSEYTLYTIAGKNVSIIDASTFSELAPSGVAQIVEDANSSGVNYESFTVDMGLTGFPQDTTFNITIT